MNDKGKKHRDGQIFPKGADGNSKSIVVSFNYGKKEESANSSLETVN
jgi:hypothetical protein